MTAPVTGQALFGTAETPSPTAHAAGQERRKASRPRVKSFLARARAHQSRYREQVLRVGCHQQNASQLDTESALKGLNFYAAWPGLLDLVDRRYRRKDSPLYNNLLRSEHIPFNFFGPLALSLGSELTHRLIKWLAPDMQRVTAIRIEHAPAEAKAVLSDNTSFDVFVEYIVDGEYRCALGIEIKYTEGPYGYGIRERERMFAADSAYHRVTGDRLYLHNSVPRLRARDLKQMWRNQLLGEAMSLHRFRSVLLYPEGNRHASDAASAYRNVLRPERQHEFLAVSYEDWLGVAREAARSGAETEWVDYLCARYDVRANLDRAVLHKAPEVIVPIKLCVPELQRGLFPACVAAALCDWRAMPDLTSLDDMLHLAYAMDDGYRLSEVLGFGHCGDLANTREAQFLRSGRYQGTAAQLWCSLFFRARAYAKGDWPGRQPDDEKPEFDALYGALIERLRAADGSVEVVSGGLTRWRGMVE